MAPADRNSNRGASPMQAGETPTSSDERTVISPQPERESPDSRARRAAARAEPKNVGRSTEVFPDKPDVVGAPERTVIAPLPPRHVDVEPIPDASSNASRLAAEAEVRRRRRADDEARFRDDRAGRDAQRRAARASREDRIRDERARDERARAREPRETDREVAAEGPRPAAKEKTTPAAVAVTDKRGPGRNDGRLRDPRDVPDQGLVHQSTSVERAAGPETPWTRLGVALRDVSDAIVESTKDSWHTLRTQGVKPFLVRMQPAAQRIWAKTRTLAMRLRAVAVTKAVELGLVKPKRIGEYEQHGDDRLDHGRVEAWRRFHKGKTSSSYLQDDE